jgi:pimeloyl-ACP methyl ester carboxylesterase
MVQLRRGYADTSGGQVHFMESGQGHPVVFLHMTADAASQWEDVLPLMAARGHRAIAFDIPGHGNSFRPASEPDGAGYARYILEALADLQVGKATLLGHHFGAIVGAWAAVSQPARVARFCAYGWPRHDAELRAKRREMPVRVFDRDGEMVKDNWARRWDMSAMLLPPGEPSRFTEALALRTMISKLQAGKTWNWAYHCIGNTDPVEIAGRIRCPVLLFAGPRDHNYQESIDAVGDFPDARFVAMDWVGVDAPIEDPEAFARVVDDFILATAE